MYEIGFSDEYLYYWSALAARYKLNLSVANDSVDPALRFMSVNWDGRIRMDCTISRRL